MTSPRPANPGLSSGILTEASLGALPRGAHVSWVVGDDQRYADVARSLIAQGTAAGEKVFAFGPSGSEVLAALETDAAVAMDPLVEFLNGELGIDAMLGVFRDQDEIARREGYTGLCVVADMDWLRAADPPARAVVQFELLLDRVVHQLGATVVCAYRASSFPSETIRGVQAVHPFPCGEPAPQFQLFDEGGKVWRLTGEVDLAVEDHFAVALDAIAQEDCVIDVAGLEFIDVGGLKTLARACAKAPLRVRGARTSLRRMWKLGCFDRIAPLPEAKSSA